MRNKKGGRKMVGERVGIKGIRAIGYYAGTMKGDFKTFLEEKRRMVDKELSRVYSSPVTVTNEVVRSNWKSKCEFISWAKATWCMLEPLFEAEDERGEKVLEDCRFYSWEIMASIMGAIELIQEIDPMSEEPWSSHDTKEPSLWDVLTDTF